VSVKFTEYFNHVAVPDIVLRWPSESKERLVYVRPSADPAWLREDVDELRGNRALIFTLEDPDAGEVGSPTKAREADLAQSAVESDTWITGPSALEQVSTARQESPVAGLLGQALVRGGRGLSTGSTIKSMSESTRAAFDGAAEQDLGSVAQSVAELEVGLDPEQSGRITRVLRAVWEGNGGAASAFPTVQSSGPLTDDDLTYLLNSLETASEEFWGRVGRSVTTRQLGGLRIADPSDSLQIFVAANLETLNAKGLRVLSRQVRLDEGQRFPRWVIDRGCLALRGTGWIAALAARRAEELPPPDVARSPSFDGLAERMTGTGAVLTKIQFGKGDRAVSYESKERDNILQDEDLARLARDRGLEVQEVTLGLAGWTVNVDFPSATALGPTSSTLPIGTLMQGVLPLLVALEREEDSAVDTLLTPTRGGTLFDDLFGEPPTDD